jgi:hypothetical protein
MRGAVLIAALAFGSLAHAQPVDPSQALAQSLFAEGRALMAQNRPEEACVKFAESQRAFPASGTLLNLGLCHEKTGRLASAYTVLGESLSRALRENRPEREKLAREHLALLEPRLSRITVTVTASGAVEGLVLKLDGAVLHKPAWGVATPVDPGAHVVEATAPGRVAFRENVTVTGEREAHRIEVPLLESAPTAVTPLATQPDATTRPVPDATPGPPATATAPASNTQRWLGLAVGGAGIVSAGVGVAFGLSASSSWSDAESKCPGRVCTSSSDQELSDKAGRAADIATVLLVAGGVAIATGAVLVLTSPKDSRTSVRIVPAAGRDTAGLVIGGSLDVLPRPLRF